MQLLVRHHFIGEVGGVGCGLQNSFYCLNGSILHRVVAYIRQKIGRKGLLTIEPGTDGLYKCIYLKERKNFAQVAELL
jgi:hypothetical protein